MRQHLDMTEIMMEKMLVHITVLANPSRLRHWKSHFPFLIWQLPPNQKTKKGLSMSEKAQIKCWPNGPQGVVGWRDGAGLTSSAGASY